MKKHGVFIIPILILIILSLSLGGINVSFKEWNIILFDFETTDSIISLKKSVLQEIRTPRTIMAILVGCGLGISGVLSQRLFNNPLAEPSLLGISTGASLFAALGLLFHVSISHYISIPKNIIVISLAFLGAILTSFLVFKIGRKNKNTNTGFLLLAGIAINLWMGAILGFLLYISNDEELRDITFWTMGSLASTTWTNVFVTAIVLIVSLTILYSIRKDIDIILLGEEKAYSLGINIDKIKKLLILIISFLTATLVSQVGMIGFIALVAPHIARLKKGELLKDMLPTLLYLSIIMLLFSDLLSKTILLPKELPIGIVTSILGAPYFLFLLIKNRKKIVT